MQYGTEALLIAAEEAAIAHQEQKPEECVVLRRLVLKVRNTSDEDKRRTHLTLLIGSMLAVTA